VKGGQERIADGGFRIAEGKHFGLRMADCGGGEKS